MGTPDNHCQTKLITALPERETVLFGRHIKAVFGACP